jgi:multicomponent K+:H+ antiporter subunit D
MLFFASAIAVAGLPPFGGFIAKAMLLGAMLPQAASAALPGAVTAWLWAAVLGGSLLAMIALARAGSALFWKVTPAHSAGGHGAGEALTSERDARGAPRAADLLPIVAALTAIILIAVAAAPLQRYAEATARDLLEPAALVEQVLGTVPRPGPHQPAPETLR